ncbi:MAG: hypothetical protein EP318_03025 [Rhodobacteraceae bacterium]|nr:MAG: hypothetical protein EP318_03025 [Paracoccaceae bacterium]
MAAQALTCLPQDVARTYHEAAESDDRYLIVLGEVRFDAAHLPETDLTRQGDTPPDTRIPARLTGRALSRGGFLHPFDREIVLNAQCFGPWCAGAVSGARYLAFVNLDRQVPEVTVTPCGGFAFAEPTARMERQVLACLNGGVCAPKMTR